MGGYRRIISTLLVITLLLLVLSIRYGRYTDGNITWNLFDAKSDFTSDIRQGILSQDNSVRDCISGSVLRHSDDAPTTPFSINVFSSKETAEQRKNSFQNVYKTHAWSARGDSNVDERLKTVIGSGSGSTLNYAQEAMTVLHTLINELKQVTKKDQIKILDIPCGDFQWMYRFLQQRTDVLYTGMDIVPTLIENHGRAFKGNPDWRFFNADVVVTPLKEQYDLVLCRMMLQQLTTSDVMKVLKNIEDSRSKYLLTTTHSVNRNNRDLYVFKGGRYRSINMELPPFSLTHPLCVSRDGPKGRSLGHYLGLWKLPLRQLTECNLHMIKKEKNYCGGYLGVLIIFTAISYLKAICYTYARRS